MRDLDPTRRRLELALRSTARDLDLLCERMRSNQQWSDEDYGLLILYSRRCWRLRKKVIALRRNSSEVTCPPYYA